MVTDPRMRILLWLLVLRIWPLQPVYSFDRSLCLLRESSSGWYDERRRSSYSQSTPPHQRKEDNWKEHWGVHTVQSNQPSFPTSATDVAHYIHTVLEAAFDNTIALDPNIVRNALLGGNMLQRRPVFKNQGRLGVELNGVFDIHAIVMELIPRLASSRTVSVHFNTVLEAVAAKHQLEHCSSDHSKNILIGTIEMDLPEQLRANNPRPEKLSEFTINPERGLVVLVQPVLDDGTAYLQKLLSKATLHQMPVVVVSPQLKHLYTNYDQSMYQQASLYGSYEPPPGPTPWILRDFIPPVVCYQQTDTLGLLQSPLHKGHVWHVYQKNGPQNVFDHVCSTKAAAGRPTRSILKAILQEYGQ